jgi:hypothetical protein
MRQPDYPSKFKNLKAQILTVQGIAARFYITRLRRYENEHSCTAKIPAKFCQHGIGCQDRYNALIFLSNPNIGVKSKIK